MLVWVEFEMGDRSKPVYCGCPVAKQGLHKDTLGNEGRTLLLSSPSGHKIVLSDNGNEINMVSVGNINITASTIVPSCTHIDHKSISFLRLIILRSIWYISS